MNPLLLIDFYKAVHRDMLPKNMTKSVSYFTPRMSRVKMWDEVVFFGLQMFITDYLINHFHEHFFSKRKGLVVSEYDIQQCDGNRCPDIGTCSHPHKSVPEQ